MVVGVCSCRCRAHGRPGGRIGGRGRNQFLGARDIREPGSRSPDARVLADHRLLSYVDPGRRRRGRGAAGFTRQPHWDRARQLGHPCERGLGCRAGYSDLCLRDAGPRWAGGNRLLVPYGRLSAAVDQTISARLGSNALSLSGAASDSVTGIGDLWPQASLRWNQGVHNFMTYVFADVPVGRYDATRLANLGLGHSAVDSGGGYTYFDAQTGNEFSAVLGFTYNFKNQSTQYQNGVDIHLDWGTSKFLTKQLQIGLVGYGYNQLSCDSGSGALVGCFESRVVGVGPQIGYILPLGEMQAYFNVKGYKEFDSAHRPRGWNTWL